MAYEHGLEGHRSAALRLPQGTRRRPHPCLLGQDKLLPTAKKLGWRYDASSPGGRQMWPEKRQGLWDLPLQQIPFPGHSFEVLSMDYNILANQSNNSTKGMPERYPGWKKQATEAYLAGFNRAYESNRAPFYIGNHFEQWNGGIYMDAVEEVLKGMAGEEGRTAGLLPAVLRLARCPGPAGARQAPYARGRPVPGRRLEHILQGSLTRASRAPRGRGMIRGRAMRNFSHEP